MESQGILPACDGTNGPAKVNCKPPPAPKTKSLAQRHHHSHLVQVAGDDEEAFSYPSSNGFDLPELPECTGMNGPDAGGRKV